MLVSPANPLGIALLYSYADYFFVWVEKHTH